MLGPDDGGRIPRIPVGDQGLDLNRFSLNIDTSHYPAKTTPSYSNLNHHTSAGKRSGVLEVSGLKFPVEITRDTDNHPLIKADSIRDLVLGQGYVHAQDRFYQMDFTRRKLKGELAAILGQSAVCSDVYYREFRFQRVVERLFESLPESQQQILKSYADGVNHALSGNRSSDAEKRAYPVSSAWQPTDSLLVMISMFQDLQPDSFQVKRSQALMKECLSEELFAFLTPARTRFDILPDGEPAPYEPMQIPSKDTLPQHLLHNAVQAKDFVTVETPQSTIDGWAMLVGDGDSRRTLLASEQHSKLLTSDAVFRNELHYRGHHLFGISVPGNPGLIGGSNRHLSWSLTNLSTDCFDYIQLEVHPKISSLYKTPEGWDEFGESIEEIQVLNQEEPIILRQKTTRWGVVSNFQHAGNPLVLKWSALEPDMLSLDFVTLNTARSVSDAIEIGQQWCGPLQNLILADKDGNIASMVTGSLPIRSGIDPILPSSWATEDKGWRGVFDGRELPVIRNPESGIVFSFSAADLEERGLQSRVHLSKIIHQAGRAREQLLGRREVTEKDVLEIQCDKTLAIFEPYRELFLQYAEHKNTLQTIKAQELVRNWNGTADAGERGVIILEYFRRELHTKLLAPLVSICREQDPSFIYNWRSSEESVLRILEEQPDQFLPSGHTSWEAFFHEAVSSCLISLSKDYPEEGLTTKWGEYENISAQSQFTQSALKEESLSQINRFRNRLMTEERVRMVVSPGNEVEGVLYITGEDSLRTLVDSTGIERDKDLAPRTEGIQISSEQHSLRLIPSFIQEELGQPLAEKYPETEEEIQRERRLNDHIISGRHTGIVTRATAITLKMTSALGLIGKCHDSATMDSRHPLPLSEAIHARYSIPETKEIAVDERVRLSDCHYTRGRLLIEHRVLQFEYYSPLEEAQKFPFILKIPMTEGGRRLNSYVSRNLASQGVASGSIERRNGLFRDKESARRLDYELMEGIRDMRGFLDWVSHQPEIDDTKLGSIGVSLGGISGCILTAVEPRIKASILALAGANFSDILTNTTYSRIKNWGETIKRNRRFSQEQFVEYIDHYFQSDPQYFAPAISNDRVLLIKAGKDSIIPERNADLLYELLGEPERITVPYGHYSIAFLMNWILQESRLWLDQKFSLTKR
ncbi:hypothetical protein EBR25_09855 [bacterium]|nr:hypothetical protein [bacterium]